KRPRMAVSDFILGEHLLNGPRQPQQTQGVSDRRTIDAQPLCNPLVAEMVFFLERLISAGHIKRVQVLTEQVLGQGELEGVLVRKLADNGGNGFETGETGRAPSAFSHYELVAALGQRAEAQEN